MADDDDIDPRYEGTNQINITMKISSGYAVCAGDMEIRSGYSATITWELQYLKSKNWVSMKSWSQTGTLKMMFEKKVAIISGNTYRFVASAKVYDSNGSLVDEPDACSASVTAS
jgi:hypothetical protein